MYAFCYATRNATATWTIGSSRVQAYMCHSTGWYPSMASLCRSRTLVHSARQLIPAAARSAGDIFRDSCSLAVTRASLDYSHATMAVPVTVPSECSRYAMLLLLTSNTCITVLQTGWLKYMLP